MLGLSRKTRGELMRTELGESWDHFMQAASYAANGFGRSVGPRTRRLGGAAARGWDSTAATLAPLAAAYREGAADATAAALKLKNKTTKAQRKGTYVAKKRNSRTGMVFGLLAAGIAAGAAGAMLMRRRRKQQWSEYDPTDALDSISPDTRSMAGKSGETMDKMSHRASKAMDKTADKLHSAASSMRKTDFKSDMKSKADETAEAANAATDNVTAKYNSR